MEDGSLPDTHPSFDYQREGKRKQELEDKLAMERNERKRQIERNRKPDPHYHLNVGEVVEMSSAPCLMSLLREKYQ